MHTHVERLHIDTGTGRASDRQRSLLLYLDGRTESEKTEEGYLIFRLISR